jgi:plasmid stabilization system protein ParE
MVRRLWDRTGQLRTFPESGRQVPESAQVDIRELHEPPYRIMYRVHQDSVEVLAIVHARRGGLGLEASGPERPGRSLTK